MRKVDAQAIFDAMRDHGVTHYCGAPIVHGLLVNAPAAMKAGVPAGIKAMVAGAAPPASMIEGMERLGFELTHVYGLTEPGSVELKYIGKVEYASVAKRVSRHVFDAKRGSTTHCSSWIRELLARELRPRAITLSIAWKRVRRVWRYVESWEASLQNLRTAS